MGRVLLVGNRNLALNVMIMLALVKDLEHYFNSWASDLFYLLSANGYPHFGTAQDLGPTIINMAMQTELQPSP